MRSRYPRASGSRYFMGGHTQTPLPTKQSIQSRLLKGNQDSLSDLCFFVCG